MSGSLSRVARYSCVFFLFMACLFQIEMNPLTMKLQNGRFSHIVISMLYLATNYPLCKKLVLQSNVAHMLSTSFSLYGLSILWSLAIILFRGGDFTYFKDLVLALWGYIFIYAALALLIRNVLRCKKPLLEFMRMFLYAQCVYVVSSALFIIFPALRTWWLGIFAQTNRLQQLTDSANYVFRFGLHGFSGFGDTIRCSIGVLFFLYLYSKTKEKALWICLPLMLLGNLFYGRSGMIFSILVLAFYALRKISMKRLLRFAVTICICAVTLDIIVSFASHDSLMSKGIRWATTPYEAFLKAQQYGKFSLGRSGDIMFQRMYFVPSDDATIFFGDGHYETETGHYYMKTDVGLMRHMLFFGIFGEIFLYASFSFLLWNLYRLFKQRNDGDGCEFSLLFLLLAFFFEIKGTPIFGFFGLILALGLCVQCGEYPHRIQSLYAVGHGDTNRGGGI